MTSGRTYPYDPDRRVVFEDVNTTVYAWPSRGGVIILDRAEAIDLEFLGLDPLNPPPERDPEQEAEDTFSQRLLLLGGKWWDSEARFVFVCGVQAAADGYRGPTIENPNRAPTRPAPTMREKRWIKVGWPSSGGLWVSEFDTTWAGVDEEENLPPQQGLARASMARTMEERCRVLREVFRGKFYPSVESYEGYGFLRAWDWKYTGEAERALLTPDETWEEWRERG